MGITAERFIKGAAAYIGYTESPPGTNRTKFADVAGHPNGYSWCSTFVVAVAKSLGLAIPGTSAWTPSLAASYRRILRLSSVPSVGAFAFFDFPDAVYRIQHVGIVESWTKTTVTCIEGNTSPGTVGSQFNGGGVYRRVRNRSLVVGFGANAFAPETPVAPAPVSTLRDLRRGDRGGDVKAWQFDLVAHGRASLAADGDFGPSTESSTKSFQTHVRLPADGIVGAKTRAAMTWIKAATNLPDLLLGSRGQPVLEWQYRLVAMTGAHLTVDGIFGLATQQATKNLQAWCHLPVDGVVGQKTRNAMMWLEEARKP